MVSTAVSKTVFPSEGVGIGSNPMGATNYNNMKDLTELQISTLQGMMKVCINLLESIDDLIDKEELQNEQFVLNFYDVINEISVRK